MDFVLASYVRSRRPNNTARYAMNNKAQNYQCRSIYITLEEQGRERGRERHITNNIWYYTKSKIPYAEESCGCIRVCFDVESYVGSLNLSS